MMDLTFNDQTQYTVLDFAAVAAEISLYPELSCDHELISIMPEGHQNNAGFYFTLNVPDQDLFRFTKFCLPDEIFFSISADFVCCKTEFIAAAKKSPVPKCRVRRNFTSHCARYIATARIRL